MDKLFVQEKNQKPTHLLIKGYFIRQCLGFGALIELEQNVDVLGKDGQALRPLLLLGQVVQGITKFYMYITD